MLTLNVEIGRDDDGDTMGKLFCCISHEGSTGEKTYISSLDQVESCVGDYVKYNFEDDGADICYRLEW